MDLDSLLKSIREENKGGAIVPAKFFGEDRYEKYAREMAQDGTLDGERLTVDERKAGVRAYRNNKIDFQKFVDNVLNRKQTASKSDDNGKSLGGGGAIVKSPKGSIIDPDSLVSPPISDQTKENLEDILKGIDSIRESLAAEKKLEDKKNKKDRRDDEKDRRAKKENRLESNIFKGIAKTVQKVLSPVKSVFDKIMNYLKTVFLGRVAYSIFEWFSDKENQDKVRTIFRFIKDWWPSLLAGLILFGGALLGPVGLIAGITALAIGFIPRLFDATKQLLGFGKQTEEDAKKAQDDLRAAEEGVIADDIIPTELQGAEEKKAETENLKEPVQRKDGGIIPGSGPNKDTVPAMLAPGEFVMSRGAVNKYGVDTLAGMNAMGGGTNRPMIKGNTLYASGGGSVPADEEPGGRNKIDPESGLPINPSQNKKDDGRAWWDFMGWAGTGNNSGGSSPSSDDSKPESNTGSSLTGLTAQDYRDLAFIVSAEAQRGTADEYGVAAAVLNRVADPAWPNTVRAVGAQAGQFEAVYKGLAKDDPQLAAKLASPEGQAGIAEALRMLKGRTDFKGTSQYGNMGQGDIKFSTRGNFYHYKEQVGRNDPPPSPVPTYYTKFIGGGGSSVNIAETSPPANAADSLSPGSPGGSPNNKVAYTPTLESANALISNMSSIINSDFTGTSSTSSIVSSPISNISSLINSDFSSSEPTSTVATAAQFSPTKAPASVSPPTNSFDSAKVSQMLSSKYGIDAPELSTPSIGKGPTSQEIPQFAAELKNSLSKKKTLGVT